MCNGLDMKTQLNEVHRSNVSCTKSLRMLFIGGGFREAGIPGSSLFSSGIPVLDRNITGIPVFGNFLRMIDLLT